MLYKDYNLYVCKLYGKFEIKYVLYFLFGVNF